MRTLIVAAAALAALSLSTGAVAQSTTTTSTTTTTTMTAGKYTLDTPIETIAADPAGKAVLDKDLPGLTSHEAYDSFKSMSLKAVQPMSNGALSDAAMAKAAADLAMIK